MAARLVTWKGINRWELERAGVARRADGVVEVPYRYPDGSTYATKQFATRRSWWTGVDPEVGLIPFGLETLARATAARSLAILVCEGESDTLAARQHLGGAFDVIGAPGSGTWKPEWAEWVAPYGFVYALGDGDDAGHTFSWRVLRDVEHTRVVAIPAGEDVRHLLQTRGRRALETLIARADAEAAYWTTFEMASDLIDFEERLEGAA
jgi:DNA primase